MSTSARGRRVAQSSNNQPTLLSLPQDIHLSILHRLSPTQLALFSQLSQAAYSLASTPSLWSSLALRHFAHTPRHLTPACVSTLARSLIHRWWLVSGAFVPDVPVHFRKGFAEIRARGGVDRIVGKRGRSAYVIGGKYQQEAVPAMFPGIGMDFYLNVQGPFPMDGMNLRILYAVEPVDDTTPPLEGLPKGMKLGEGWACIKIRLNGQVLDEFRLQPTDTFEILELHLNPDLLRTKPRVNNLDLEVDRNSSAPCWLQEVTIVPAVLPVEELSDEKRRFHVVETKKKRVDDIEHVNEQQQTHQPQEHPMEREGDTEWHANTQRQPRLTRRLTRAERELRAKGKLHDIQGRARNSHHKYQNRGNPYMYGHGNHARSPRGQSLTSPRTRAR